MGFGKRRTNILYVETPAGQREAERKKNDAYSKLVSSKISGLQKVDAQQTSSNKDLLEHIRAQNPRGKWSHIGYENNSNGSRTKNFYKIPGGYFVDFGTSGVYYIKPKAYKKLLAASRPVKIAKFGKISKMLKKVGTSR
jgi:hypothetical protein